MADLWLPDRPGEPSARRIAGNDAGSYRPFSTWSFLLHTTEGSSLAGAVAAYRQHNSWPHLTFDPVAADLAQHVPFNRPARALRNASGGVETNRYRVIQLEIVGFAAESHTWPDLVLSRLGHLLARVRELCPFDLDAPYRFLGQGDGTLATTTAKQRMTFAQWYRFRGICGHQHAPENTHWDPGRIDIAKIIDAAGGGSTSEELTMDKEAQDAFAALNQRLDALTSAPVPTAIALRDPRDKRVWAVSAAGRWHVPTRETLSLLIVSRVVAPGEPAVLDHPEWLDSVPIISAPVTG